MPTFALPPLRLPRPNIRSVPGLLPIRRPEPEPVASQADPDEVSRPVSASSRELTIPDVVPAQRASWRRPARIRGRAS